MGSLTAIFFTSFMVALSGALMPGPLLTATIAESSRCGSRAGPLLMIGHGILELALVVLLFQGLAPLLTNARIIAAVCLVGGAILFWLSYGMFRSLPRLSLESAAQPQKSHTRLIVSGILISLSNPYWSIWWATIGLAYILQSRQFGAAGIAVFFIGHIIADLLWYSLVSVSIGKGRRFFTPGLYRVIVGGCAGFLVVFGALFLYSGIKRLLS
jgi:threonine/homoserine/homoserine lactone efflux protein